MLATLNDALALLTQPQSRVLDIVPLSQRVSCTAVAISTLLALPFGAWVAATQFPARGAVMIVGAASSDSPGR